MYRRLLIVAMLGGAAVTCLLTSPDVTAAPMPAVSPDAVHGSSGGSAVEPVQCIRYCVRRELCLLRNGRLVCVPTTIRKAHCVEWATACRGGHY